MPETKERPIIFSGEMVRAILDGHKDMTRRVVTPTPQICGYEAGKAIWRWEPRKGYDINLKDHAIPFCPYGKVGDHLWVRETMGYGWACGAVYMADFEKDTGTGRATGDVSQKYFNRFGGKKQSLPSIHMPRWASRITLEVTAVRVERVQEISMADAMAEGTQGKQAFATLWDAINANRGYSWDSNPWVWVVSFRRIHANSEG